MVRCRVVQCRVTVDVFGAYKVSGLVISPLIRRRCTLRSFGGMT
jgi:hypothetical protein